MNTLKRQDKDRRRGIALPHSAGLVSRSLTSAAAQRLVAARSAPIIVYSHLRWDFVWQRPQQILSRLAAYHPIVFIEEPIEAKGPPRLETSMPHVNVLRVLPKVEDVRVSVDAQQDLLLPMLKGALLDHSSLAGRVDAPSIHWFYTPMPAPRALDYFKPLTVVYDCMDELASFRFAPADLAERELLLLSRADVVFTGGYQLFEAKSRNHRNVHFYGSGVDTAHFGRAQDPEVRLPSEVAQLPRPIFGYFGVVDERLDYDLLYQLAAANPHASLVIVGPAVKVDQEQLPRAPNIHWLGQRAYSELPALVKSFDVCLMPFALNEATRYINPTKTLEYMAAGKPIVSTAVPDVVRHFAPIAEVAHSRLEFIQAVERAAVHVDAERIGAGIERARQCSWETIVASMRHHILESVIVPRARSFE